MIPVLIVVPGKPALIDFQVAPPSVERRTPRIGDRMKISRSSRGSTSTCARRSASAGWLNLAQVTPKSSLRKSSETNPL